MNLHVGSGHCTCFFISLTPSGRLYRESGDEMPNVRAWTSTALYFQIRLVRCAAFGEHKGTHPWASPGYTGHFSSFHAISQNIHS